MDAPRCALLVNGNLEVHDLIYGLSFSRSLMDYFVWDSELLHQVQSENWGRSSTEQTFQIKPGYV